MPNWCENELRVTGDAGKLKAFREAVKSEGKLLDANKLIPYPEHFRRLDEIASAWDQAHLVGGKFPEGVSLADQPQDGFNSGGHEWQTENWGTKWGFCDVEVADEGEGYVEFIFTTAWGPLIPLIKKMGEMFPDLTFDLTYREGGVGFQGTLLIENGRVVKEEQGDYEEVAA